MPNRDEIINEFKKYDPGRNVSEQDIANAEKHGLGLIKETFKKPGVGGGEGTAKSIGQTADTTPMSFQMDTEKSAQENLEGMTQSQPMFEKVFEQALKMKQERAAPFNEAIAKKKRKLRNVGPEEFSDLSPDARLLAMTRKANRIKSSMEYLEQQKAEQDVELQDIMAQTTEAYNAELSALGLKVQSEQEIVNMAFSPAMLLGGVPPEGMPAEFMASWQAASNAARMEAASSGGGGYGPSSGGSGWDLANSLGYSKKINEAGTGYDFFKDGQPVNWEEIAQATQMTAAEVLKGSSSPQDYGVTHPASPLNTGQGPTNEAADELDELKGLIPD